MKLIKSFIKQVLYLIMPPFFKFLKESITILIKKIILKLKEKDLIETKEEKKEDKKEVKKDVR